jgi:hypothetical protein
LQFRCLLSNDGDAALDAVRTVGIVWQVHFKQLELVDEFLHVWVVPLILIEYPCTVTVYRFQVGFNTSGLVSLLALIPLERALKN